MDTDMLFGSLELMTPEMTKAMNAEKMPQQKTPIMPENKP